MSCQRRSPTAVAWRWSQRCRGTRPWPARGRSPGTGGYLSGTPHTRRQPPRVPQGRWHFHQARTGDVLSSRPLRRAVGGRRCLLLDRCQFCLPCSLARKEKATRMLAARVLEGDDGRVSPNAAEMVAVLMTDLEGSTAMADRVGPAAAEELHTEHVGLLRVALEHTGGREVKNLGDGLMVVFSSASESLERAPEVGRPTRSLPSGPSTPLAATQGRSAGRPRGAPPSPS
jgi:hypothetical protein